MFAGEEHLQRQNNPAVSVVARKNGKGKNANAFIDRRAAKAKP
jgi:hypothetical protein